MALLIRQESSLLWKKLWPKREKDYIFSFFYRPMGRPEPPSSGSRWVTNNNVAQIASDIAVAPKNILSPTARWGRGPTWASSPLLPWLLPRIRLCLPLRISKPDWLMTARLMTTNLTLTTSKQILNFSCRWRSVWKGHYFYTNNTADVKSVKKMGKLYDRIRAVNHFE